MVEVNEENIESKKKLEILEEKNQVLRLIALLRVSMYNEPVKDKQMEASIMLDIQEISGRIK